jgi:ribosome-associated protein
VSDAEERDIRERSGDPLEAPRRGLLRVGRELSIPLAEIVLRTSRSSGPGGQHANVTASRVEAVFDVRASRSLSDAQRARVLARAGPRIVAVAQDERSQSRNRELALERLAERLQRALTVPRRRRATAPTRAARDHRLADKRRAAQRKLERRPPPADGE